MRVDSQKTNRSCITVHECELGTKPRTTRGQKQDLPVCEVEDNKSNGKNRMVRATLHGRTVRPQRECPADLKEGISSLIFAAPRCSDIPELLSIRDVFHKKYGKDFVSAATDLRPNAGVNRMLIEKLSVKTPSSEIKLKVLKEIAKEYQVQCDTTESEELLKPPEERIGGPEKFESAASLHLKPVPKQYPEPINTSHSRGQHNITTFEEVASPELFFEKALVGSKRSSSRLPGVNDHPISRNSTGNFMPNSLPTSQAEYSTIDDQRRTNGSNTLIISMVEICLEDGAAIVERAHTDIKVDESDSMKKLRWKNHHRKRG
ncbi:hypothetical protein DH2020_007764 [Rehmannia glutinosa]|uniref:Uncharacterized protein n=1 Tax=Rehmannia glutinosa TaxID=99300 RepID=A0ABR0U044_REHGL